LPKLALGLIETVGLAAAVEAADAAVKSANISLIGYELSKGGGLVTVKLEGDVGAVKSAVEAGCAAAVKVNKVWSKQVIPRPHEELDKIICSRDTVGAVLPPEASEKPEMNDQVQMAVEGGDEEDRLEAELEADLPEKAEEEAGPELEMEKSAEIEGSLRDYCNLCFDPLCPRKKGELRSNCIHYEEVKEVL